VAVPDHTHDSPMTISCEGAPISWSSMSARTVVGYAFPLDTWRKSIYKVWVGWCKRKLGNIVSWRCALRWSGRPMIQRGLCPLSNDRPDGPIPGAIPHGWGSIPQGGKL